MDLNQEALAALNYNSSQRDFQPDSFKLSTPASPVRQHSKRCRNLKCPNQQDIHRCRSNPSMTSSEIASSFQDGSGAAPTPPPKPATGRIPNIRLSFITAQDQAKFEQLFKSAVGDNQAMTG
ncbi:hypothetical protein BJX70DRAFT_330399 [Aspergillus crustosus]